MLNPGDNFLIIRLHLNKGKTTSVETNMDSRSTFCRDHLTRQENERITAEVSSKYSISYYGIRLLFSQVDGPLSALVDNQSTYSFETSQVDQKTE